jgi:alkylated DNA repair protein alkB family protein 1
MPNLDAHARPPELLRQQYKRYQKASIHALDNDPDLFDFSRLNLSACSDRNFFHYPPDDLINIYSTFLGELVDTLPPSVKSARLYEHPDLPGMPLSEHGPRNSFLSLR